MLVLISTNWDTGTQELDEWSQYDIETDPELWQLKQDFVDRESIKAKDKAEEYFQQAVANPEEPSEDSHLISFTEKYNENQDLSYGDACGLATRFQES